MKIMLRILFCSIICLSAMPLCAIELYPSEAMAAFSQDPIALQAIKQHQKQSRRVRFINNIKQTTDLFKAYDNSLTFVDPICIIDGKTLRAEDECDVEIENDHCMVTINLRPGFAQFVTRLGDNLWSQLLRCIEKYVLLSRSFTFICDLTECDSVDTATLFFQAYSQTETGNYTVRMRSPLGLEISLPSPIKY